MERTPSRTLGVLPHRFAARVGRSRRAHSAASSPSARKADGMDRAGEGRLFELSRFIEQALSRRAPRVVIRNGELLLEGRRVG